MVDFTKFTPVQWLNISILILASVSSAAFWQDWMTVRHAADVSSAFIWVTGVLNILVSGGVKPTPPAPVA